MNFRHPSLWISAILFAALLLFFYAVFSNPETQSEQLSNEIPYSEFFELAQADLFNRVDLRGTAMTGHLENGQTVRAHPPAVGIPKDLLADLLKNETIISVESEDVSGPMVFLVDWFPVIVFYLALWFFFTRPIFKSLQQVNARLEAMENIRRDEKDAP